MEKYTKETYDEFANKVLTDVTSANKKLRTIIDDTKGYGEIAERIQILEEEAEENSRIIGMSGSRELKLITELEQLKTLLRAYRNDDGMHSLECCVFSTDK